MKNYIEDFENFELPDLELEKEDISNIKKVVIREGILRDIRKLIKYNTKIKIDFTEDEVLKIYKEIENSNISKDRGSKERIFLRTLVMKTLDKEVLEKNKSIIKTALIYNPNSMKIPYWFRDKYYTKLYLTENKIIKYEITNSFDVLNKEEILLNDIKYVGKKDDGRVMWTIQLKYRDISWPVKNDYVSEGFGEFIRELSNLGIPDNL